MHIESRAAMHIAFAAKRSSQVLLIDSQQQKSNILHPISLEHREKKRDLSWKHFVSSYKAHQV